MITLSPLKDGAIAVDASGSKFHVFPGKPEKDTWSLLSEPVEELKNEKEISWPGEYDFGGISVRGVGQEDGKQVSYSTVAENIFVAFVNAPVLKWTDAQIEKLGEVDVLAVAADDAKKVQELVEAIDPRMVVLFGGNGDMAGVIKALGADKAEKTKSVKIKKSTLPQETREVVILG